MKRRPEFRGKDVHLDQLLNEYYECRGWTSEGVPTAAKFEELGLQPLDHEVIDENRG